MKKIKWKKILLIVGIILLGFIVLNLIGVPIAYDICMSHPKDIDFNITPGVINYEEYKDQYKRDNVEYMVDNHKISGYAYMENTTDYLIVSVHGYRDYADYLMVEDFYFVDHGYNVFSFDLSGCGNSEGSINGFSQGLIDLEATMKFLNTDTRFKDYKKLLFGFSEGGYSSLALLALTSENIYGVAAVSSYNDAENLIAEKGFEYVNFISYLGKPLVWLKEKSLFGDYLPIRAVDGINNTNLPIFLAHGTEDTLITYNKLDTYSLVEESDRIWKYSKAASHSGILYSDSALQYREEVEDTLYHMKDKDKEEYYKSIDDWKYSEVNDVMFPQILSFYEYCKSIKKLAPKGAIFY